MFFALSYSSSRNSMRFAADADRRRFTEECMSQSCRNKLAWNECSDMAYNGVRLLILGESHYDADPPAPDSVEELQFTQAIVRDRHSCAGQRRNAFFPGIYRAVTGKDWSAGDRAVGAFWKQVYFANYLQEFLPGPGAAVPAAWFRAAEEPFHDLLEQIQPEAVLVLGVRLWRSMPEGRREGLLGGRADVEASAERYRAVYSFALKSGARAFAAHIPHPSSIGFRAYAWTPLILTFLKSVREGKHPCRR
jgi:hypothetical protein